MFKIPSKIWFEIWKVWYIFSSEYIYIYKMYQCSDAWKEAMIKKKNRDNENEYFSRVSCAIYACALRFPFKNHITQKKS